MADRDYCNCGNRERYGARIDCPTHGIQHPTTPTPEPVAPESDCPRGLRSVHEEVLKQRNAFHEELVDLRGKLERAERERASLARSFDAAATARDEMEALRDAATARATEAERLLRTVVAKQDAVDAMRPHLTEDALESLNDAFDAARKHLSTLPGSKESE